MNRGCDILRLFVQHIPSSGSIHNARQCSILSPHPLRVLNGGSLRGFFETEGMSVEWDPSLLDVGLVFAQILALESDYYLVSLRLYFYGSNPPFGRCRPNGGNGIRRARHPPQLQQNPLTLNYKSLPLATHTHYFCLLYGTGQQD